jgi:hypothetical protein
MYISTALLAIAASALAMPVTQDDNNSTLVRRQNYCAANVFHFPTAEEFKKGYTQFCNNHAPTEIHRKSSGLTYTLTLQGADKKPINFVYKVSINDKMKQDDAADYSFTLSQDLCKEKFGSFLTGAGGGMPKVYCEWDEDALPGWPKHHTHLLLGGTFSESLGSGAGIFGNAVYETRPKKGEKGIPFDTHDFDF